MIGRQRLYLELVIGEPVKFKFQTFIFLQYFSNGIFGPYLVVYLSQKGFSGAQIGLMLGVMPIASILFQPVWGYLSDVFNQRRILLLIGSLGVALACLGLVYAETFIAAFLCSLLFSIMMAPLIPISTAMLMDHLEELGKPEAFSLFRLWGSLGFGISSILMAGLFLDQILVYFGWFMVVIYVMLGGLSLTLPEKGQTYEPMSINGLTVLIKKPEFLIFLAGSAFIGATLGISLNYQTLFLQNLNASSWLIGAIVSIQALLEIPFMLMVPWLLRRFSIRWLILAGALALPLRWLSYIFIKDPAWVLPTQVINGISTISFFVVAIAYIDQLVSPQWRATGQGLYSAVMWGIGAGLGSMAGGYFLGWYGVRSVWYMNVVLGMLGLGLIMIGFRKSKVTQPQGVRTE